MLNNERIVYLPVQIYLISNKNIRNWMHISMLGKFLIENPIYKLCTNQNLTEMFHLEIKAFPIKHKSND